MPETDAQVETTAPIGTTQDALASAKTKIKTSETEETEEEDEEAVGAQVEEDEETEEETEDTEDESEEGEEEEEEEGEEEEEKETEEAKEPPVKPPTPKAPQDMLDKAKQWRETGVYPFAEEEQAQFKDTVYNAKWEPKSLLEFFEVYRDWGRFRDSREDQMRMAERQAVNDRMDSELAELEKAKVIPAIADPNSDADPGVQARRAIFKIATEEGDREAGTILPIKAAAKLWRAEKSSGKKKQPPGAKAPVSGGREGTLPSKRPNYEDIHGKDIQDLVQEDIEAGRV